MNKSILFTLLLAIPLAIGFLASSLFSDTALVYNAFNLPPFSPPASIFGIAWTIIYILMGIASFFIFTAKAQRKDKISALFIYFFQLIINFFWTYIFFNLNLQLIAFLWIIFLILLVYILIKKFYPISKIASYLLLPYFLWLCYASYLNLFIFLLN